MRKAGSGVMTDKDFEVFKSMVGGLDSTREANQLILSFRNHLNKRKTDVYEAAMKYRQGRTSFMKDKNGNALPKAANTLDAGFEGWLHQQKLDSYDLTIAWKRGLKAKKIGVGTRSLQTDGGEEAYITEIPPGSEGNT